ncbi:aryldialkylphosphatase [Pseudonocardia sulfidoxydans NBRC 16205]|uniref:Aryldialkylphosphatase n=1 Tax=Pseudonocardia sulfidoxydans NBRC 16205 TaxID=1223511 RepID=A0A511DMM3_9PSEU|nr:phosphotriesterase-related protein [Pseudonocardia sulfidoxydans]GEL25044.1 aryldialkylphosphatase [Pseudonocardia sulfidoxydans NBRC 16205]
MTSPDPQPPLPGAAMTVCGPIDAADLGQTLMHEHLYADFGALAFDDQRVLGDELLTTSDLAEARWDPSAFVSNRRFTDIALVAEELGPLVAAGGRTVVDCTPRPFRNPAALAEISQRAGVHVVMGAGYYIQRHHPDGLADRSAESIADEMIADYADGADGSGIRPGIIGEIGTSATVSDTERRVLMASAWAQKETGLTLSIHLQPWAKQGHSVLDLLLAEGADPTRILLNHVSMDFDDETYQLSLLDRGPTLGFDLFGYDHSMHSHGKYPPSDHDLAMAVVRLGKMGFTDRVILSHDIAVLTRLRKFGGWGFAHVHEHIVPLLLHDGLTERDVEIMLTDNPQRLLTVRSDVRATVPQQA